ncbi:NHL repeat-containing protein [Candidatus Bipolaricaulota bacterium]
MERRRIWTACLVFAVILLSSGATALAVGDLSLEYVDEWYVEDEPHSVAVDEESGDVFVTINNNYRILRYSAQGDLLGMFGRDGELPVGLAVDAQGFIVVAVNINNNYRIIWYDASGQILTEMEGEGLVGGISADTEGHSIVAVNINQNYRVVEYLPTGEITASWDGEGKAMAIGAGVEGQISVVASVNNMLHVVQRTREGELLSQLELVAGVSETNGIVVAPGGEVFVGITNNHRVAICDADGEQIGYFGEEGSEAGFFSSPWGMAMTQAGLLFVADSGNNRIQVFQLSY